MNFESTPKVAGEASAARQNGVLLEKVSLNTLDG